MVMTVPGAAVCLDSREKPSIREPVAWKQSQCRNMRKHNVTFQLKWNGKCCPAVLIVHEVIDSIDSICGFSAGCGAGERTADHERELQKGWAWFIGWSHNFDKLTNRVTSLVPQAEQLQLELEETQETLSYPFLSMAHQSWRIWSHRFRQTLVPSGAITEVIAECEDAWWIIRIS